MTGLMCFENFECLCDAMSAAAIAVKPDYRITVFNKCAETLFGLGRHIIIGQQISEIIDPAIISQLPFGSTLTSGAVNKDIEITLTVRSRSLHFLFDLLPLKNPDDNIVGLLIVIRESPANREAEQRMRHLELLAGIGQMAAGTIHEIRNPLTSINGFVQLLQVRATRQKDETAVGYCSLITNEITHINNILSDFLTLAKPSERKIGKINIVQIVHDVNRLIYGEALLYQIKLVCHLPEQPLYVLGSGEKIKEVLINLYRNAIQAMTYGGILTIAVNGYADNICISLSDTGHGMTEATIANIFKPFFTTKETGTGLGLAICQQIMRDHQGDIKVKSEIGKGSTFTLVFPCIAQMPCDITA